MIYVFVNPIDPEVCENFLNLGLHIIITKRLNLKKKQQKKQLCNYLRSLTV